MKTGILGATLLITATTVDDAIWLVPYTTSPHLPPSTKIIHGITFLLTLEGLSLLCVGFYSALKHGLFHFLMHTTGDGEEGSEQLEEHVSFIMESIGVLICWSIAIFLFTKKMLKNKRKQQRLLEESQASNDFSLGHHATHSLAFSMDSGGGGDDALLRPSQSFDGGDLTAEGNSNGIEFDSTDDERDNIQDLNTIPTTPSVPLVISLTTLGALDEISYFPALIMGKIFTPTELCVGAFMAALIILSVITLFLAQCKPLVDCLDRIPLYGIVGTFAVVLTVGLFF